MTNKFILTADDAALRERLQKAADEAIKIISRDMKKYDSGDLYPGKYIDGKYNVVPNAHPDNTSWQEGFWPGQLWLCYELTGDEKFKELGDKYVVDFAKRYEENNMIDWHHDLGFLYSLSCVAPYKLTGNALARETAEMAAFSLSRRFRWRGEFIQSMSTEIDPEHYRFIIDTMMNLPLLFWAADITGKDGYRDKAIRHAETTRRYILRPDGSTYHHFLMDFDTAGPKHGLTLQGLSDDSCWSRGQSWMVYGSAMMYGFTGDESWIDTFEAVTDYFVDHLPDDYVPHWDFAILGTDDDDRDSSAGAIAVCGILEMANHLGTDKRKMPKYIGIAKKMLLSLSSGEYAISPDLGREGLLDKVMPAKLLGECESCAGYGDYFYLEALTRALHPWEKYW